MRKGPLWPSALIRGCQVQVSGLFNISDPLLLSFSIWFSQHTVIKKHVWRSLHTLQQGRQGSKKTQHTMDGQGALHNMQQGGEKCHILHRKKGHKALWVNVGTHVRYVHVICMPRRKTGWVPSLDPSQWLSGRIRGDFGYSCFTSLQFLSTMNTNEL